MFTPNPTPLVCEKWYLLVRVVCSQHVSSGEALNQVQWIICLVSFHAVVMPLDIVARVTALYTLSSDIQRLLIGCFKLSRVSFGTITLT